MNSFLEFPLWLTRIQFYFFMVSYKVSVVIWSLGQINWSVGKLFFHGFKGGCSITFAFILFFFYIFISNWPPNLWHCNQNWLSDRFGNTLICKGSTFLCTSHATNHLWPILPCIVQFKLDFYQNFHSYKRFVIILRIRFINNWLVYFN